MTAVTVSTCLYYSHNASEWREVLKQVKALANLPLTCFLHKSSRNFIKKEGKEKGMLGWPNISEARYFSVILPL